MTFRGKQQNPAIRCCYVEWSKVRLLVGLKKICKKWVTLDMVKKVHSQPDHVQENWKKKQNSVIFVNNRDSKIVNNQYSSRFVYSHFVSVTASDRCNPEMPDKSYAEVLKTDLQSKYMPNYWQAPRCMRVHSCGVPYVFGSGP